MSWDVVEVDGGYIVQNRDEPIERGLDKINRGLLPLVHKTRGSALAMVEQLEFRENWNRRTDIKAFCE